MAYPKFESILLEKDKDYPKVTYLTLTGRTRITASASAKST